MRTKRLGDMLIELGLLTNDQLKQALEFQAKEKDRLGTTLVKHNFITEHQLIDALRMQLGIDYIDLTKTDITPEMSSYVPKNLAKKMNIVPVRVSKDQLYLAMADPLPNNSTQYVRQASSNRDSSRSAYRSCGLYRPGFQSEPRPHEAKPPAPYQAHSSHSP